MNWTEFRRGLADIAPMVIAYAPIGALWGTVAASKGLSPAEALLMSLGVYSGAAQFVAMDVWTQRLPLLLLAVTIFTVGLRHVLMSASLSRHIVHFPAWRASVLLFWLTDEAWALMEREARQRPITPSYFAGVSIPLWPTWAVGTFLGALAGNSLGDISVYGLDFAFPALFIAVVAGFWRGASTAMVIVASAVAAILVKLNIDGAWYILVGGIAGMLVAVLTYRENGPA
jgi:4-azaleucine resistance transporter AzlC